MYKPIQFVLLLAMCWTPPHLVRAADRATLDPDALAKVQKKLADLNVRGTLAFTAFSAREGESRGDIYIVSATTSKRITDERVNAMGTAWSPDGRRIAFSSVREGLYEMHTINADGTGLKKLAIVDGQNDGRGAAFPSWSLIGRKIVFELHRNEVSLDRELPNDAVHIFEPTITVINSDGSDRTMLRNGHWPRWSPDGKEILFHSTGEESFVVGMDSLPTMGIYSMNPNGHDVRRLTDQKADAMFGCWSPDGKQIVFSSNRDHQTYDVSNLDLYLMNADGAARRRLTESKGTKICPSWSPGGEWIAFHQSDNAGRSSIWLIQPDGSKLTRLTGEQFDVGFPAWCPDQKNADN